MTATTERGAVSPAVSAERSDTALPAHAVTVVHGTFPCGLRQQLRRNLLALWARIGGGAVDEASLWRPPRRCACLPANGSRGVHAARGEACGIEPLPNWRSADDAMLAEMALELLYEARPSGLNHSLYDAPELRDRIARWFREQMSAALGQRS